MCSNTVRLEAWTSAGIEAASKPTRLPRHESLDHTPFNHTANPTTINSMRLTLSFTPWFLLTARLPLFFELRLNSLRPTATNLWPTEHPYEHPTPPFPSNLSPSGADSITLLLNSLWRLTRRVDTLTRIYRIRFRTSISKDYTRHRTSNFRTRTYKDMALVRIPDSGV